MSLQETYGRCIDVLVADHEYIEKVRWSLDYEPCVMFLIFHQIVEQYEKCGNAGIPTSPGSGFRVQLVPGALHRQ